RRLIGTVNQENALFKTLIEEEEDIYLLGIILQEVGQGIRNSKWSLMGSGLYFLVINGSGLYF
ncbi:MAG: hypothetical protein ACPL6D_14040, partial [Thermodesulfobacteriota bacterium]